MASPLRLPPPTFDLDTYANNYSGPLLPLRLARLAAHCPSLSRQAIALALASAKSGKDVRLYTRLCELARALGQDELGTVDAEFVAKQEEANKRESSRLEAELRGYKNNLIRESIRMGQEDLATHLLLTGGPAADVGGAQSLGSGSNTGLNASYAAFGKMRDYCTTPTHVAAMTLRLTFTALLQAVSAQLSESASTTHYNAVLANANRLRSVGVKEEEAARLAPLSATSTGLAHLGLGKYRDAAAAFLSVSFDYAGLGKVHAHDFTREVASPNDVAVYGGLTALATLTREDLMSVLGGPFRAFLELEPHLRKAISLFTTAKYQACLALLARYYSDWSLDVFLGAGAGATAAADAGMSTATVQGGSHVDRLFARIREKSITAYFAAFSSVSIAALAATFPPPANINTTATNTSSSDSTSDPTAAVQAMESELLALISTGALHARLDTVNGLLVAPSQAGRTTTYAEAGNAAAEIERTLLLRLHRVNVALAGLEVPRPKSGPGGGGGGGWGWENGEKVGAW